jgi:hypothetical protein
MVALVAADSCGNAATCTVRVLVECLGSIGDRVWRDALYGDGIQGADEPGIPNVPVYLYVDAAGNGQFTTQVATATTDWDGRYFFSNLVARSYVVQVEHMTILNGFQQTGDPDYYGTYVPTNARDHRTTAPIVLGPGENFRNADFGYMWPPLLSIIGNIEAFMRDGQTVVAWETIESWGTAGYFLERWRDNHWVRISPELVPFPIFGVAPVLFEEVDVGVMAGETHLWRLVELETTGQEWIHGPYSLTVAAFRQLPHAVLASGHVQTRKAGPALDGLKPAIASLRCVPDGFDLTWSSVSGRLYRIAVADRLGDSFQVYTNGFRATGNIARITIPAGQQNSRRFFQVIEIGP